MNTATCRHCGGTVARRAMTCPHCGGTTARGWLNESGRAVLGCGCLLLVALVVLGVLMLAAV